MTIIVKALSGVAGLVAASFWFMSAAADIPPAPGAAFGGTSPTDPFNVAIRHSAQLNEWAAGATGVSVLLMVIAEFMEHRNSRRSKRITEGGDELT